VVIPPAGEIAADFVLRPVPRATGAPA
jgi:hypothetical protein